MALNIGKTAWNFAALRDCGRYHLFVDYHSRTIKYWCKILNYYNESRYVKKCYNQLFLHDRSGKKNWASGIRKLVCSLGFGYAWFSQSVGNEKIFLSQVKDRLKSISIQELNAQCKLHFPEYLDYHPDPFAAPYLSVLPDYHLRKYFASLHCNNLPVKCNLLSRINITENNLCESCQVPENEFHILFECKLYEHLRLALLPRNIIDEPSKRIFISLLNSSDEELIKSVSRYLQLILKNREHFRLSD